MEVKYNIFMNDKIDKIYVHIGVMKTATSSLQQSLFKNRKVLKSMGDGYLYPQVSYFHHGRFFLSKFTNQHVNPRTFVRKFDGKIENMKDYAIREQAKFENEVINTNCKNVVVSGEQISFFNLEQIKKFKNYLLSLAPNAEIYIVVCTREHTSRFASEIQQSVKVCMQVDFNDYIKKESQYYKNHIEHFLGTFGKDKIIAYKFEDIKKYKNGPIELFFKKIKADIASNQLFNFRSNEGYSGLAVDILMYINNRLPLITDNELTKGRRFYDDRMLGRISGEKYLLSKEMIENIHNKCMADKVWLRDNLGIDYTQTYSKKYFNGLKFNKTYLKEFKCIFIKLKPVIQKLCYDYICEKISDKALDYKSKSILAKLKDWTYKLIPDLKANELDYFIQNNDKKYKTSTILELKTLLFFSVLYYRRFGIIKLFDILKNKDGEELYR